MFTMKNEVVGRSSVVSGDFVESVDQKICERRHFTISELSCELPKILHTLLYEIITVRLGYHKFCATWVPKMLTNAHKTQRMASALTFLQQYHKDSDEFLNHIGRGDETWVSFVTVQTKERSRQWMHPHLPNRPKNLNRRCLPES
jgi:hypothetical protein